MTIKKLDLVDREAVKDAIGFMNLHFLGHGETKSVLDSINEVPTVDAVEVVHGRWIDLGRNYYTVVSQCSECSSKYDFRSHYCPNCGAKMDGDTD